MNKKKFNLIITCFTGSYILFSLLNKLKIQHINKILNNVKKIFSKKGPITGSWIEMKPTIYTINDRKFHVNYGGIIRLENNKLVEYEFIVDSINGTIIDTYQIIK